MIQAVKTTDSMLINLLQICVLNKFVYGITILVSYIFNLVDLAIIDEVNKFTGERISLHERLFQIFIPC